MGAFVQAIAADIVALFSGVISRMLDVSPTGSVA